MPQLSLTAFPRARRLVLAGLVLTLLLGGLLAFVVRRDDQALALSCPEGYSRLGEEYLRELRAGAHAEAGEERESEREREKGGRTVCLRSDIRKPEPFADLMKANAAMFNRFALQSPASYAQAVSQAQTLTNTGIPGTAGTWSPVGNGPVVFDNANYTNTNGLNNGLSKSSGRISAYAHNTVNDALYASVANGGVWRSADRGRSWTSIGDKLPTQIVGSLGWTPSGGANGTLVALTGDNAFGGNTYPGLGIYWSTDEGTTWTKSMVGGTLTGLDGSMGFRVAVDPGAPAKLYAATGFGLFRSTDSGRSWANVNLPVGSGCTGIHTGKCFLANVVTDVAVRGGGGKKAATDGAVTAVVGWRAGQRKNPDGSTQAPNNGIYTSDTGVAGSFTKVPDSAGFAPTANVGRTSLGSAYGPNQDHNYLYALVQDAELFNKGTIEGIDVPTVTEPVLGTCPTCTSTYLNGVYVSKDFGRTWTLLTPREDFLLPTSNSTLGTLQVLGFGPGIQSWYNSWIQPNPFEADANGVPTRLALGLEEVWENRMTAGIGTPLDGSAPVTDFTTVAPYAATGGPGTGLCILSTTSDLCNAEVQAVGHTTHPDQHASLYLQGKAAGDPVSLFVGNDGGNYVAPVPGSGNMTADSFGPGAQSGFNTLLPYSVAVAKDGTVYAGLQDNGTVKIAPADVPADGVKAGDAIEVYGGDGTAALVDPDDSDQAMFAPAGGSAAVTHDGGKTNESVYPYAKNPQFVTPFAYDDNSSSREIYAARDIWISNKKIADMHDDTAWTSVYDLGTNAHPGDAAAEPTDTDPPNVSTAVGMRDGTAYVGFCGSCDPVKENLRFHAGLATNQGGTWHIVAASGLPQRLINAVKVDPADPSTVYVGLGGSTVRQFAPPHALGDDGVDPDGGYVYKSTDGGATFTDVTGDLPKTGVTALQVVGGQLVAGTTVGVFASAGTAGGSWGKLGDNLPSAPVNQVVVDPSNPKQIYVASFGRGIYRYTMTGDGTPVTTPPSATPCTGPTSRLSSHKLTASAPRRVTARGTSRPGTCGRVVRVEFSVARRLSTGQCRYLAANGAWTSASSCTTRRFLLRATGTTTFSYTTPRLGRGDYRIWERAVDIKAHVEKLDATRNWLVARLT